MKMEQTECSETSAYKIQTPGNYPEENIKHFTVLFAISGARGSAIGWGTALQAGRSQVWFPMV